MTNPHLRIAFAIGWISHRQEEEESEVEEEENSEEENSEYDEECEDKDVTKKQGSRAIACFLGNYQEETEEEEEEEYGLKEGLM